MPENQISSPEKWAQKAEEPNKVLSAFYALTEAINQSLYLLETLKLSHERVKAVIHADDKLLPTAKLQSLCEMAAGIAQDFNNILMVILGHTELLLHEAADEILIKKIKIIEQAARDGSETVGKIGDFTRAAPKETEDSPPKKQAARILVVDDEPDNLDLLSEMLERLGHHAGRASNAEAGLEKFKAEGPWDMVFTDLGLPGISGWDLVRELKALEPELPAVLITGWGFQLQEDEIKAKKVDYVLSKPFKIKDITRVIDRILARQG